MVTKLTVIIISWCLKAKSSCCTPKTYRVLYVNYTSIKKEEENKNKLTFTWETMRQITMITITCNKFRDSYAQGVMELIEATLFNYINEGKSQMSEVKSL